MTVDATTRSLQHTIGADGLVVLTLHSGDLRIRGVAGDDVRIRARDGSPLDGMSVERGERSLTVRAGRSDHAPSGRHHGGSLDLEVEVPSTASVVIEGASSDIVADGLAGDQRFRTASGDLLIRGSRGNLTAEAMSGDIDVTADGAARFDLRTASGDLSLRAGVVGTLRATTTSGDLAVTARFDGEGPYAVETVSGDVELAPAGDVRLDIRTIAGDVHCDLPHRVEEGGGRRSFVIGAGGPTVDVRSTSGDIRITHASGLAALPPAPPEVPAPPPLTTAAATPDIAGPSGPETDAPDLAVLRALEQGDIDLDEARRRLAALDPDQEADRG